MAYNYNETLAEAYVNMVKKSTTEFDSILEEINQIDIEISEMLDNKTKAIEESKETNINEGLFSAIKSAVGSIKKTAGSAALSVGLHPKQIGAQLKTHKANMLTTKAHASGNRDDYAKAASAHREASSAHHEATMAAPKHNSISDIKDHNEAADNLEKQVKNIDDHIAK